MWKKCRKVHPPSLFWVTILFFSSKENGRRRSSFSVILIDNFDTDTLWSRRRATVKTRFLKKRLFSRDWPLSQYSSKHLRGGIFERERERNDAVPNSGAHFWTLFCISPDKTSSFFGVWSTTLLIFFFSDSTCLLNNHHHHHHHHHQSRVREESAGCFVVWLRSSSLFFFVFVVGIKVV